MILIDRKRLARFGEAARAAGVTDEGEILEYCRKQCPLVVNLDCWPGQTRADFIQWVQDHPANILLLYVPPNLTGTMVA
jgi:hypothetical protein